MLTLVIGNKNYSSWSLRTWALLRELEIEFNEIMVKFESHDWERNIQSLSPSGLVPVLWEGTPGSAFFTCDTLAIAEKPYELFPNRRVWPEDPHERARARSLCEEFHSGFHNIRSAMPMNIRADLNGKGHTEETLRDIQTICDRWKTTRREFGGYGNFLFGSFSVVDAYYLPVASRFRTYDVSLDAESRQYVDALVNTKATQPWIAAAQEETEFVEEDEPSQTSTEFKKRS